MHLDKGNLRTFLSFFLTEFSVVLTHPTFLEAAEFPSSDDFPFFCAKPIGNSRTSFPEMLAVCGTGTANIVEH
jgi:hypothetical protein